MENVDIVPIANVHRANSNAACRSAEQLIDAWKWRESIETEIDKMQMKLKIINKQGIMLMVVIFERFHRRCLFQRVPLSM